MSSPEAVFHIIEDNNCPLYQLGDEFILSGQALLLKNKNEKTFITTSVIKIPMDKPACRILVEDITAVLIKYETMSSVNRCVINCSGCSGIVRLEYNREKSETGAVIPRHKQGREDIGALVSLLYIFPIFQSLNEKDIKRIVPFLRLKKFPVGHSIIKKGDTGNNLYILISGRVEVLVEEDTRLGFMERGDVFGEISLLIGTPASTTIRVVQTARVLYVTGKDFKAILNEFPSLQMYFARLLAERLARTNDERLNEFASGMVGKLSDISVSELLQTLNLNSKTGILHLDLPEGGAKVVFRDGALIGAKYGRKVDKEAFFDILKEKRGRFKFVQGLDAEYMDLPELGDFMWLLMEGIRRIDEEVSN